MLTEGIKRSTVEPSEGGVLVEGVKKLGLMELVSGGIQIDVNVASKRLPGGPLLDAAFCEHNCRIVTNGVRTGNYECPAAITLNPGLSVKTLALADRLIEAVLRTAGGIRSTNQTIETSYLSPYFESFNVPEPVQGLIRSVFLKGRIEVNLFGGNPELHPEITRIVKFLKGEGFIVHLTTTGARFMRDQNFLSEIVKSPPDLIALSADDFESSSQIALLANLELGEIRKLWGKIPAIYGQRRKALEAIYVANLARQVEEFPRILFNFVVHPGNLDKIEEIIDSLTENFPEVLVNPYLAQSAFYLGEPVFIESHTKAISTFIDRRISDHIGGREGIVRRLHYWLMLKAAATYFASDRHELARRFSGYDVWRCYRVVGAGRYVQIGASDSPRIEGIAGGHLACFWNSHTVTLKDKKAWDMETGGISQYVLGGMGQLAAKAEAPCPGCIMPRLNFDMVSLELGMDQKLRPDYLELRKGFVGF